MLARRRRGGQWWSRESRHWTSSDHSLRHAGTNRPHREAGRRRRKNLCARDHRTRWRVGCRRALDARGARRRLLRHRRPKDIHHVGRTRRFRHRRGPHGRRRARWHLDDCRRARDARFFDVEEAEKNGLVGERHRRARVRILPGACEKSDRRRKRRVFDHRRELRDGAPLSRRAVRRHRGARLPRVGRVRAGAPRV